MTILDLILWSRFKCSSSVIVNFYLNTVYVSSNLPNHMDVENPVVDNFV